MTMSARLPWAGDGIFSRRRSGILLHPSSLPGPGPVGDIGREARHFVDFLADTGQTIWQMLPLVPPDSSGSPYQSASVHAADNRLISLACLVDQGWLAGAAIAPPGEVDSHYDQDRHQALLVEAFQGFQHGAHDGDRAALAEFVADNASWLDDYALYMALKRRYGGVSWVDWPVTLRDRQGAALARARKKEAGVIAQICFEQFCFSRQWTNLKRYANERGIMLFGDMPIFVAHDSADVWANRELFALDGGGRPLTVAGVPPDYFSETGQRWGNPHYCWEAMQADDFAWWRERIKGELAHFDLIRIDHFRGFEAYWEIPAGDETAIGGHWVPAPGDELFASLERHFGRLPFIAEDLGIITEKVTRLRLRYGLPGMKILQFAFDSGPDNPYLPHNHEAGSVVYTGTHDNDTTLSWFNSLSDELRGHVYDYLGGTGEAMPWALMRAALASPSCMAILPMQDVLSLGEGQRMNTPGTDSGNWQWRFSWSQMSADTAQRLRHMTHLYGRSP